MRQDRRIMLNRLGGVRLHLRAVRAIFRLCLSLRVNMFSAEDSVGLVLEGVVRGSRGDD